MISCIIVDDEQHAIDIIAHYISQTPFLNLTGSTTNPVEALEMVASQNIDLVFLDIQMPELSGIDFIKAINGKSKVILTTAYSEFALEGYELDIIDYLMKPIRFPRFLTAVQKAMKLIGDHHSSRDAREEDDDFIFVKTESKGKLLKINLDEIDYIEGMKNYVAIHRAGQKTLVYTNLKDLEEKLSAKHFLRIHKSFIIPLSKITGIEGNRVRIKGVEVDIFVGDSYKDALMNVVKGKMID